jgi:hypothetical protein
LADLLHWPLKVLEVGQLADLEVVKLYQEEVRGWWVEVGLRRYQISKI